MACGVILPPGKELVVPTDELNLVFQDLREKPAFHPPDRDKIISTVLVTDTPAVIRTTRSSGGVKTALLLRLFEPRLH
jgi:hypothetical protein